MALPLLRLDHFRGKTQIGGQLVHEPRMESDLRDGDSFHRVHNQHAEDKVSRELAQMGGQRVHARLDLLEQIGDGFVVEGKGSAEEGVEDDAHGPHIDLGAGVEVA